MDNFFQYKEAKGQMSAHIGVISRPRSRINEDTSKERERPLSCKDALRHTGMQVKHREVPHTHARGQECRRGTTNNEESRYVTLPKIYQHIPMQVHDRSKLQLALRISDVETTQFSRSNGRHAVKN